MRQIHIGSLVSPKIHQSVISIDLQKRGRLLVEALETDVFRVRYLPDGVPRMNRTWVIVDQYNKMPREGRSRDDLSRFSLPELMVERAASFCLLATEQLKCEIAYETASLSWQLPSGEVFASDMQLRSYARDPGGRSIWHYMRLRDDACFYGFGERSGRLNKRGYRMEMRNLDALGYDARSTDPLYKHFPVYITFLPELKLAYGLVYDNLATTVFDMGKEIDAIWGPSVKYMAEDGDIDYYLLFGPTIQDVVEKIAWLTGYPFLPPRYTLGYLGSTMSYTDAPNAAEQLGKFVDLVAKYDIPCDGFHLSSGYTTDQNGVRNVFTWNHDRIPSPSAMVQGFHVANIHLIANVKPYIMESNPHYADCVSLGCFLQESDGLTHHRSRFWSGGAYESADGTYIDFTSDAGYNWWQAQLNEQLFAHGVNAIWNDNNEYEVLDGDVLCNGFGVPFRISLGRPIQTLLMAHASYHATLAHAPKERPFVISRSGALGMQRYVQSWSGDNSTSWDSLQYNIPMGLGMSLSGAPNIGHDVGGFHGPAPSTELFVRWVQNGIFHPRFTIHSWNTDGTVNEPWMYLEVLPFVRNALQFRYRILPYLYSLFVESYLFGRPIIRPMVYHFSDDAKTLDQSFDFLLGPNLLVATVFEEGARIRKVYLPAGTSWYDFHTGVLFPGGAVASLEAPLSRFPLLVPEGGIVPMGRPMRHVGEKPDNLREFYLFPHKKTGQGHYVLYEDDGVSPMTRQDPITTVTISITTEENRLHVQIDVDENLYQLPYREIRLKLPPGEMREVSVNGFNYTEHGTPDQRMLTVNI
jgi:alpha-glucosidase